MQPTPFFPEVLVASSVMAEGVDLHLDCRHVIHHDLDWNPSVLEQRTGRLDRLGSKAELTRKPIVVFDMTEPGNLARALLGEHVGTLVSAEQELAA